MMIVSVLYPHKDGAKFDAGYYKSTHAPLATEIWNPERVDLVEGLPGPDGTPSPYALVAHFHFASPEALGQAMANPRLGELQADVANFTDIVPTLMIGKTL